MWGIFEKLGCKRRSKAVVHDEGDIILVDTVFSPSVEHHENEPMNDDEDINKEESMRGEEEKVNDEKVNDEKVKDEKNTPSLTKYSDASESTRTYVYNLLKESILQYISQPTVDSIYFELPNGKARLELIIKEGGVDSLLQVTQHQIYTIIRSIFVNYSTRKWIHFQTEDIYSSRHVYMFINAPKKSHKLFKGKTNTVPTISPMAIIQPWLAEHVNSDFLQTFIIVHSYLVN